ncbi:MAG: glutathione S-transferase [Pseudomonadota bacterium]
MYTLYGAKVSYFSGKARAYLNWKGVPYREVGATKDIYTDIILPKVGWPVIPVVAGPGDEILQDTSDIIDTLEARHGAPSVYPDGPVQKLAALLFEVIGDEWLVIPAMHYRWAYNRDYAYAEFGKMSAPDAAPEEQFDIGRANATRFEGALPLLGITPETVPAIEASYETLLSELDRHFATHAMLFGDRPSIGDLGLYGPLYAHLYLDPASGKIMKSIAPNVYAWVERLRDSAPGTGAFLDEDAVPDTLLPVLQRQLADFVPVLVDTAAALTAWAEGKPAGEAVPRALGPMPFRISDTPGNRMIFPFNLWMLQRPMDHYASLAGKDKDAADAFLSSIGAEGLASMVKPPRLARENFKLVLAE